MNEDILERLNAVRPMLDRVRAAKDAALALIDAQPQLEDSWRRIWCADAREMYNNLYAAWLLAEGSAREGDPAKADSSRQFLLESRRRLDQSASELQTLPDPAAPAILYELRHAFGACWRAVDAELRQLQPEPAAAQPVDSVVMAGQDEVHLLCSVCGKVAVRITRGVPRWESEQKLLCQGIVSSISIPLEFASQIFSQLNLRDLAAVHTLLRRRTRAEDGLDAYCPDCDKIFCRAHYQVREEWDEGFYDCAYGTCPAGHRRIIDD